MDGVHRLRRVGVYYKEKRNVRKQVINAFGAISKVISAFGAISKEINAFGAIREINLKKSAKTRISLNEIRLLRSR